MSIRWKKKVQPPRPKEGDERTVRKFLLIPRCICGEYRWLGREAIIQRAYLGTVIPPDGYGWHQAIMWADAAWGNA